MKHYYDDFTVGDEFTSPARTITESDVVMFAGLSGDYNPIHTDLEHAKQSPYGERVAHGMLVMAVVTGLKARIGIMNGTIMGLLGVEWRFKGAVRFGDTVHCVVRIGEMRETSKPDRGIVIQELRVLNQRGELIQEGTMTTMLRRRTTDA